MYNHECIKDYVECVQYIVNQGFIVKGMVVDGMRGLFKTFSQYQVQMCQYHRWALYGRYLTQNPRLEEERTLIIDEN